MGRKIIIILDGYIFDVYILMIRTVDNSNPKLLPSDFSFTRFDCSRLSRRDAQSEWIIDRQGFLGKVLI